MKYAAVLFDVGDTLLSYYPDEAQIQAERLRRIGFDVDDRAAIEIAHAMQAASLGQIAREQRGAPRLPDQAFQRLMDRAALGCVVGEARMAPFLESLAAVPLPAQELRLIPGALHVLETLSRARVRLGIVSNHRAWLADHLREIGLAGFFQVVVISDMVGIEKPDPRIMALALDALALDGPSCLYVGDHPFDVLCAKRAGLDCAWIAAPEDVLPESVPYHEDYRLTGLSDLLAAVGLDGATSPA